VQGWVIIVHRQIPGFLDFVDFRDLQVLQSMTAEQRDALTPLKLRYKARDFAMKEVAAQREQFKRWVCSVGSQSPAILSNHCLGRLSFCMTAVYQLQSTSMKRRRVPCEAAPMFCTVHTVSLCEISWAPGLGCGATGRRRT
jgi:hypothetical protein